MVVRARQPPRCRAGRSRPPAAPSATPPGTPCGQRPTSRTPRASARGDPDHPVILRPLRHLVRQIPPLDLVHPDHGPVRPAFGEEPALGREVAAHPAMPVKMIGRQVREDRDIGRQRPGKVGLVGRQLQHDTSPSRGGSMSSTPAPDVPGHLARPPRGREDVVDQRRGRGLAVRPRHRDHARRAVEPVPVVGGERPEEQPDVVVDRHAPPPARGR